MPAPRAQWPRPCQESKRNMRPRGTRLADMPDTVPYGQGQKCLTCHRHLKDAAKGKTRRTYEKPPEKCRDCHRPLRPSGTTLEDYPGTVEHQGRGLCMTDYMAHRRAELRAQRPAPAPTPELPRVTAAGETRATVAQNIQALDSWNARRRARTSGQRPRISSHPSRPAHSGLMRA